MSSVLLQAGITYAFSARFMFELANFALVGGTAVQLQEAVSAALRTIGIPGAVRVGYTQQGWGRETLLIDMVFTPGADIQTGGVASVPDPVWGYVGPEPVIPEPSASVNGVLWWALNGLYVRLRGGPGNVSTDWSTFGRPECAIQFSGYDPAFGSTEMVDGDSVLRSNVLPSAQFGSNILDRATYVGTDQTSTDATLDSTNAAGLPSIAGLGTAFTLTLIVVGGLAVLIAVGYAARGIADVARET